MAPLSKASIIDPKSKAASVVFCDLALAAGLAFDRIDFVTQRISIFPRVDDQQKDPSEWVQAEAYFGL